MGCSQSSEVDNKGPQPSRKSEVSHTKDERMPPTDNGHIPSKEPSNSPEELISAEAAAGYISERTGLPECRARRVATSIGADRQGRATMSNLEQVVRNIIEMKRLHMGRLQSHDTQKSGRISHPDAFNLLSNQVQGLSDVILHGVLARQSNNGAENMVDIVLLMEFCAVVKLKKEVLYSRFQALDVDRSGDLDMSEILTTIMHESGVDEACAKDIIQQFDVDDNGKIDMEEFIAMWIRLYG